MVIQGVGALYLRRVVAREGGPRFFSPVLHPVWLVQILRRFPPKNKDFPARADGEGKEQFNFGVGPPGGSRLPAPPTTPIHVFLYDKVVTSKDIP